MHKRKETTPVLYLLRPVGLIKRWKVKYARVWKQFCPRQNLNHDPHCSRRVYIVHHFFKKSEVEPMCWVPLITLICWSWAKISSQNTYYFCSIFLNGWRMKSICTFLFICFQPKCQSFIPNFRLQALVLKLLTYFVLQEFVLYTIYMPLFCKWQIYCM